MDRGCAGRVCICLFLIVYICILHSDVMAVYGQWAVTSLLALYSDFTVSNIVLSATAVAVMTYWLLTPLVITSLRPERLRRVGTMDLIRDTIGGPLLLGLTAAGWVCGVSSELPGFIYFLMFSVINTVMWVYDLRQWAQREAGSHPAPRSQIEEVALSRDGSLCVVCLEQMQRGQRVAGVVVCQHRFHEQCLRSWLSRNATCPVCRASANRP